MVSSCPDRGSFIDRHAQKVKIISKLDDRLLVNTKITFTSPETSNQLELL